MAAAWNLLGPFAACHVDQGTSHSRYPIRSSVAGYVDAALAVQLLVLVRVGASNVEKK